MPALLANPLGRALLGAALFMALLTGAYVKGRADGSSACVNRQFVESVKVEQKAQKARAKVRRTVPQSDDQEKLLQWLDTYAVPRF